MIRRFTIWFKPLSIQAFDEHEIACLLSSCLPFPIPTFPLTLFPILSRVPCRSPLVPLHVYNASNSSLKRALCVRPSRPAAPSTYPSFVWATASAFSKTGHPPSEKGWGGLDGLYDVSPNPAKRPAGRCTAGREGVQNTQGGVQVCDGYLQIGPAMRWYELKRGA